MLIGVISDSHDNMGKIRKAVEVFNQQRVELVIHCGDYVAPFALKPLRELHADFLGVLGNNEGELAYLFERAREVGELHMPPHLTTLDGKRLLISHYPMTEQQLAAYEPPLDFFFYGHTHKIDVRHQRGVMIMNPGECGGWLSGKATVAVLELTTGRTEIIEL